MVQVKSIGIKIRVTVMYLFAVFLILLIPLLFISLGSKTIEKIGRHIPIKEGTFNAQNGKLKLNKPSHNP